MSNKMITIIMILIMIIMIISRMGRMVKSPAWLDLPKEELLHLVNDPQLKVLDNDIGRLCHH